MTQKPDGLKIKALRNADFQPLLCSGSHMRWLHAVTACLHERLCVPMATFGEKSPPSREGSTSDSYRGLPPARGSHFAGTQQAQLSPACRDLPVKAGINIFTLYPQEHPSIKDPSECPDECGALAHVVYQR